VWFRLSLGAELSGRRGRDGDQIARFHYAQTKIDQAPDTILVDEEVVAVIQEQQQAVWARYPGSKYRYLFPSAMRIAMATSLSADATTRGCCADSASWLISGTRTVERSSSAERIDSGTPA
jgi:hypothetical protein